MLGWFVGQVMKSTGGKANPQAVSDALKQAARRLSLDANRVRANRLIRSAVHACAAPRLQRRRNKNVTTVAKKNSIATSVRAVSIRYAALRRKRSRPRR